MTMQWLQQQQQLLVASSSYLLQLLSSPSALACKLQDNRTNTIHWKDLGMVNYRIQHLLLESHNHGPKYHNLLAEFCLAALVNN